MTEKDIDSLYDMVCDSMQDLKSAPLHDFAHVGALDAEVQVKIQALSETSFSARIISHKNSNPIYVQGTKTEILFSLKYYIREAINSNTTNGHPKPPPKDDLDAFFGNGINFLPRGRP